MTREECIEAGIHPSYAGNVLLSDWTWKLIGGVCLFGIVLAIFGN